MNRVEMGIGTTQVLQGGIEITTKPLIDIEVSKNPDVVDMSEAGHVVLNPLNISYVLSNADNGRTGIINFDAVQAAAHTHGNSHDRHITEDRGINYDQMAGIASAQLSAMKGKQFYFAGYLNMNKGREISRTEALNVLESYEKKDLVEVTVWMGDEAVTTIEEGYGEHVIVDFEYINKNNELEPYEDNINENSIDDAMHSL